MLPLRQGRRPGPARSPRPVRALRVVLILLILLSLVSCDLQASPLRLLRRPQQQIVPLRIVEGPNNSVLALVPVFVQGQGPFTFALDTGASQSLFDREIVDRLGLPIVGRAGRVTGITGVQDADLVRVSEWRIGDEPLPSSIALTLSLPEPNRGMGLQGLLGSDVLSRFGAITVDYEREVLILRSRQ